MVRWDWWFLERFVGTFYRFDGGAGVVLDMAFQYLVLLDRDGKKCL